MKDIVYVYKHTDTDELRYSLRSVVRFLSFNKVWIIGDETDLDVNHIHVPQRGSSHEDVGNKMRTIVDHEGISDDFILMNDDLFLMEATSLPYYYSDTLENRIKTHKGKYTKLVYERFPSGHWCELHFPIVYNKKSLKKVLDDYDIVKTMSLRTYYCNALQIIPEYSKDYKITTTKELYNVWNYPFFSTSDEVARTPQFKWLMDVLFPEKTKYE